MKNKIPLASEHPPRRTWASMFIGCFNERSYSLLYVWHAYLLLPAFAIVTIGTNDILVLHPDEIVAPCATVQPMCEVSFVLEVLPHKPHYYFRFFFIVHLHDVIELFVTHIVFDFHLHSTGDSFLVPALQRGTHSPPFSRHFCVVHTLWVHCLESVFSS